MILDSEIQRNALLQLLKSSTFSGEQIEFVHGLQQAIRNADIRDCGTWKGPAGGPLEDGSPGDFQGFTASATWVGLLRNAINKGK